MSQNLTACHDHSSGIRCICRWDRRSRCFRHRLGCDFRRHFHPKPKGCAGRTLNRDLRLVESAIRAAVDVIILRLAVTGRQTPGEMQGVTHIVVLPEDRVQDLS